MQGNVAGGNRRREIVERESQQQPCVPRREKLLEARVGIEPTYKGFADLSLTTWVPRLGHTVYRNRAVLSAGKVGGATLGRSGAEIQLRTVFAVLPMVQ